MSILPRRMPDGLLLGRVLFMRLRWWNAVPVALAPFPSHPVERRPAVAFRWLARSGVASLGLKLPGGAMPAGDVAEWPRLVARPGRCSRGRGADARWPLPLQPFWLRPAVTFARESPRLRVICFSQ